MSQDPLHTKFRFLRVNSLIKHYASCLVEENTFIKPQTAAFENSKTSSFDTFDAKFKAWTPVGICEVWAQILQKPSTSSSLSENHFRLVPFQNMGKLRVLLKLSLDTTWFFSMLPCHGTQLHCLVVTDCYMLIPLTKRNGAFDVSILRELASVPDGSLAQSSCAWVA